MARLDWLSRELLAKRTGGALIVRRYSNNKLTLKDILDYGNNQYSEAYDAGYRDGLADYHEMKQHHGGLSK